MTKGILTYIDLFCGIGGFHAAANEVSSRSVNSGLKCVFASDIDIDCQKVYEENYGIKPFGDISKVNTADIPKHDLLFAGFPCQPFSIIGRRHGFEDTRGTLFFEIARILKSHKPRAFVLENVKMLRSHNNGETLATITSTLNELGYYVSFKVLNALDFGLPQKRERIVIVGFKRPVIFGWPSGVGYRKTLHEVLETNVSDFYTASETIRKSRASWHKVDAEPTIWHENKSGNVSKLPYSCALRAGASYNYLLVNGERRLTEREMLRLQGFPDSFRIVSNYTQARKQAGNSVPVPMISAVIDEAVRALGYSRSQRSAKEGCTQLELVQENRA